MIIEMIFDSGDKEQWTSAFWLLYTSYSLKKRPVKLNKYSPLYHTHSDTLFQYLNENPDPQLSVSRSTKRIMWFLGPLRMRSMLRIRAASIFLPLKHWISLMGWSFYRKSQIVMRIFMLFKIMLLRVGSQKLVLALSRLIQSVSFRIFPTPPPKLN